MNQYLLRSMMFVPGHNKKLLASAAKSKADALILDIEDSVVPNSNKQIARQTIRDHVLNGSFKGFHVFVRVNDRESGELLNDVSTLAIDGVDGFVYPKSCSGQDIYFFDKLLATIEHEEGFSEGNFKIVPLIETTAAVLNAMEICKASDRVIAIAFGCEDFVSDLCGVHTKEGDALLVPRALIAMAARATGVIPVDTVHIKVHDLDDFAKNVQFVRKLGFEGTLILHPKELDIAHKCFSPSVEDVERANEMLRLSKVAGKDGKGVAVIDGKFIGPPMVKAARKIIDRNLLIKSRCNDGV